MSLKRCAKERFRSIYFKLTCYFIPSIEKAPAGWRGAIGLGLTCELGLALTASFIVGFLRFASEPYSLIHTIEKAPPGMTGLWTIVYFDNLRHNRLGLVHRLAIELDILLSGSVPGEILPHSPKHHNLPDVFIAVNL